MLNTILIAALSIITMASCNGKSKHLDVIPTYYEIPIEGNIIKAPLKIADDVITRSIATTCAAEAMRRSKQASYSIRKTRDCFAPLAMTDAFFEFLEVPINYYPISISKV